MKQGEVWLVNFDPQLGSEMKKQRPAVIVETEPFINLRRTAIVVPLSTAHDKTEFPLLISPEFEGFTGVAVMDQIKACDKRRFVRRLGVLTDLEMTQISRAVAVLFDFA